MTATKIIDREISELTPYKNNARTHTEEQVEQLMASIQEFGFTNPVLITDDGLIVAGHGRVMAAKRLGLEKVPTMTVGDDWTEEQIRAYVLADNQLALEGGWDHDLLKAELLDLGKLDFDIGVIGFDTRFVSKLLSGPSVEFTGSKELDVADFEEFEHKCPRCGFEFNEEEQ
jgi:ParB-like chromosome segregation protein Spo0J